MVFILIGAMLLILGGLTLADACLSSGETNMVAVFGGILVFISICCLAGGWYQMSNEKLEKRLTRFERAQQDGYTFYLDGEEFTPDGSMSYEDYVIAYDDNRQAVYIEERN